jgi:methylenetetrahydrofolate dehydrogenase (NADP+)/methenyltetrahydrofolate cyclohydrolase
MPCKKEIFQLKCEPHITHKESEGGSMAVLDGKVIARVVQESLKEQVAELKGKGITPTIAPILVGDNPGAKVYYRTKEKLAEKLGVRYAGLKLPESTSQEALIDEIHRLNDDPEVHGLFVELPLPKGISIAAISREITPQKDIDCINPASLGHLVSGGAASATYSELKERPDVLLPATPQAVMELLLASGVDLAGKETVVVGAGAVGLPLALLLLREGYANVTLCEYKGKDLHEIVSRADVVCVSVGRPNFITAGMVKEGAVVIDVGINVGKDGITGDVDYAGVEKKASLITPVPGGVGPMTTTLIMANTVKAASNLTKKYRVSS